jgi:hypothetical protein
MNSTKQPAVGAPVEATVRLPAEISPDGRELWDWAARFSDRAQTLYEITKLGKQVHNTRNTCGSCTAWMTDACPREKRDNRTGRKQGPSSMAIKCERFSMSARDEAGAAQAEEKIAALRLRLQQEQL